LRNDRLPQPQRLPARRSFDRYARRVEATASDRAVLNIHKDRQEALNTGFTIIWSTTADQSAGLTGWFDISVN